MKRHQNSLGYHFYLPIRPVHLFGLELFLGRINLYFPLYLSLSFGLQGRKGLQLGGGIKFDPTETIKLKENDYLFSAHFRIHTIGRDANTYMQASL